MQLGPNAAGCPDCCQNRLMSSESSGSGSIQQSDRPSAGILRRIGDDFRRGHNVELYLTVTLSLFIPVLGVFSVVNISIIGAATLAVLALLAASGLETRHQSEEIGSRLERLAAEVSGNVPADRFLTTRRPVLEVDVAAAADIRLVGVSLVALCAIYCPSSTDVYGRVPPYECLSSTEMARLGQKQSLAPAVRIARTSTSTGSRRPSTFLTSLHPLHRLSPHSSHASCRTYQPSVCALLTQQKRMDAYTSKFINTGPLSTVQSSASRLTVTVPGTSISLDSLKRCGTAPALISCQSRSYIVNGARIIQPSSTSP
jgi:hypothetical protein